jgi:hypothetical protein
MNKYESFCVRLTAIDADQFRADTLENAKGLVLDKIRELKERKDISEENREYWIEKYANAVFVHRIVIEDVVTA